MTIYDFKVRTMDGNEVSLSDYKEKVLLIVNTATGCGFTPQYDGLQELRLCLQILHRLLHKCHFQQQTQEFYDPG